MGCYHIPGLALFPPCLDLNVRFWPKIAARPAFVSVSFGESQPKAAELTSQFHYCGLKTSAIGDANDVD
jgi:hypothetical protein